MYRRKTISCQLLVLFGHRLGRLGIRDDELNLFRLTGYVKCGYPLLDRFTDLRKTLIADISVFC